jgi:hypothetical protein
MLAMPHFEKKIKQMDSYAYYLEERSQLDVAFIDDTTLEPTPRTTVALAHTYTSLFSTIYPYRSVHLQKLPRRSPLHKLI